MRRRGWPLGVDSPCHRLEAALADWSSTPTGAEAKRVERVIRLAAIEGARRDGLRAEGEEAAGEGGEESEDTEFDAEDGAQLAGRGAEGAEEYGIVGALFASVEENAGHDENAGDNGER